jgi:hypothetical protein
MSDLINLVSQAITSFDPTRNNFQQPLEVKPAEPVETPAPAENADTQDKE